MEGASSFPGCLEDSLRDSQADWAMFYSLVSAGRELSATNMGVPLKTKLQVKRKSDQC